MNARARFVAESFLTPVSNPVTFLTSTNVIPSVRLSSQLGFGVYSVGSSIFEISGVGSQHFDRAFWRIKDLINRLSKDSHPNHLLPGIQYLVLNLGERTYVIITKDVHFTYEVLSLCRISGSSVLTWSSEVMVHAIVVIFVAPRYIVFGLCSKSGLRRSFQYLG